MGRSIDFPVIFYDLLIKYKSKSIADKEYQECLIMAKEQGLSKAARLSDIDITIVPTARFSERECANRTLSSAQEDLTKHPPEKKQRVVGGFSNSEKVILLWLQ